jgi:hypothetical protein
MREIVPGVWSTVPHGGTVLLEKGDIVPLKKSTATSLSEEDMKYIFSAPTVEEGARRMCEIEDRIWLELVLSAIAPDESK